MLKVFAVRMLRRFDWSAENQDLSPTKGEKAGQGMYDKRPQPARAEIRRPGDGST